MKDTFSNRLRYALNYNNMKAAELVEKTGLSKSLISGYLNGKFFARQDKITLLANILNVNEAWLMGYDVPIKSNAAKIDNNITGLDKKTLSSATVLVYGTIPAGTPIELIEDVIDTEEIDVDMLKGGKQYFGLKVKGHSMEPEYLDGDIIILQKVDDCENGEDCVVMVNGNEGTFKRVLKDEEKRTIRLQPLNTQLDKNGMPLYEPKTYTEEDILQLPVKIIGRAVELRRKKRK